MAARNHRSSAVVLSVLLCALMSFSFRSQELQHSTGVINVEVPVRVFAGGRFIESLTIKDFELFEDGKPQKIVGLYLFKKNDLKTEEAPKAPEPTQAMPAAPVPLAVPKPETARNFLLMFEVRSVMPKIDQALDYFFNNVFRKGDQITVISPMGNYRFKPDVFERASTAQVAAQIKSNLRHDIIVGALEYNSIMKEIQDYSNNPEMDPVIQGRVILNNIRLIRDRMTINDAGIRKAAAAMKAQDGQNIIFIFYEKEEIVIPVSPYEDSEYAREARRPVDYDLNEIKKIFSDASLTVNFIFLAKSRPEGVQADVSNAESWDYNGALSSRSTTDISGPIFQAFHEVARATGGKTETSANAMYAFKKTSEASENYYILYYSPADYKAESIRNSFSARILGRVRNRLEYPILTSSTSVFRPAGEVKRGPVHRKAVRTGESGRLRLPRGDSPDALRRPGQRSRYIFGRGVGKEPGRRVGLPKELLEGGLRRRGFCRYKGELQVLDDPIDDSVLREEGDDAHRAAASRTDHRVDLVDLADHGRPALGGDAP